MHQLLLELVIAEVELARDEVLRVVAPVAVGADPDLEERRLVLGDRTAAGGGERADPLAGPDEGEPMRELDLALVPGAVIVHPAVPHRADLALAHPRLDPRLHVLHRAGCEL